MPPRPSPATSDLLAWSNPEREGARSPPAPQTEDTDQRGFADSPNIDGGMPPAFLNHRVPTALRDTDADRSIFTRRACRNRCRRIAAAPLALPPAIDLVRTSAPAQNDPSAVFEIFIAGSTSRCCDDRRIRRRTRRRSHRRTSPRRPSCSPRTGSSATSSGSSLGRCNLTPPGLRARLNEDALLRCAVEHVVGNTPDEAVDVHAGTRRANGTAFAGRMSSVSSPAGLGYR